MNHLIIPLVIVLFIFCFFCVCPRKKRGTYTYLLGVKKETSVPVGGSNVN